MEDLDKEVMSFALNAHDIFMGQVNLACAIVIATGYDPADCLLVYTVDRIKCTLQAPAGRDVHVTWFDKDPQDDMKFNVYSKWIVEPEDLLEGNLENIS